MERFALRRAAIGLLATGLALTSQPAVGQPDPIAAASDAIGATGLRFVHMRGFGGSHAVGQSPRAGEPWPRVQIKTYEATIDYDTGAMTTDIVLESGSVAPRGGLAPIGGERRQVEGVAGTLAWNTVVPAPTPAGRGRDERSEAPAASAPSTTRPAPQAAALRRQQIYLTPHGFLKAALANKATTRAVPSGTEVSFLLDGRYRFIGLIDENRHVAQVKTFTANPVIGDMSVEASYSHYIRVGTRAFPTRIRQKQGDHLSLDLWLSFVADEAAAISVPAEASAAVAAPPVEARQIADGVFYLTGGSHHSVAVAMLDHVVLIEAPQDEARALAVMDAVRASIPGRPIRFVINTHHHFDHSGGLRALVDSGAVVVTHAMNRPFYEAAWKAPRTLSPDRLSASAKPAAFRTFDGLHVLTDGRRRVEVHPVARSSHAADLAMIYLPAEKILVEADAFTPPVAGAAPPPPVDSTAFNLHHNVVRLRLDVQTIVALHGSRLTSMAELAAAAGRHDVE
jgi:glyoxylase-like metal-dependent hydrolase (beta-lactamase superfamily II)